MCCSFLYDPKQKQEVTASSVILCFKRAFDVVVKSITKPWIELNWNCIAAEFLILVKIASLSRKECDIIFHSSLSLEFIMESLFMPWQGCFNIEPVGDRWKWHIISEMGKKWGRKMIMIKVNLSDYPKVLFILLIVSHFCFLIGGSWSWPATVWLTLTRSRSSILVQLIQTH